MQTLIGVFLVLLCTLPEFPSTPLVDPENVLDNWAPDYGDYKISVKHTRQLPGYRKMMRQPGMQGDSHSRFAALNFLTEEMPGPPRPKIRLGRR